MNISVDTKKIHMSFLAIWFAHMILDFMLGVWPVYKTLAHLDIMKAGWIAGIGMFIGEGLQLFFGILSDRGHQQRLIVLGLILVSSVSFLTYTDSYFVLFILMLCTYAGSGAFHPAAVGIVGNWSSSRKGMYVALFSSGGMAGEAVSQRLFSEAYEFFEGELCIFLVPISILIVWCWTQKFPIPVRQKVQNFKMQMRTILFKKPEIRLLYIVQVLVRSIVLALMFLLPEVLMQRGYDTWFCLGGGYGFYILGSALMSIPAGHLSDRYGILRVLCCAIACSAVIFSIFIFFGTLSVVKSALLLFMLGGCTGIVSPLIVAAGTRLVPQENCGLVGGLLMGAATCLASLSVMATGMLTDCFGREVPAKSLEVVGLLYFVIFFFLWRLSLSKSDEKANLLYFI